MLQYWVVVRDLLKLLTNLQLRYLACRFKEMAAALSTKPLEVYDAAGTIWFLLSLRPNMPVVNNRLPVSCQTFFLVDWPHWQTCQTCCFCYRAGSGGKWVCLTGGRDRLILNRG